MVVQPKTYHLHAALKSSKNPTIYENGATFGVHTRDDILFYAVAQVFSRVEITSTKNGLCRCKYACVREGESSIITRRFL